MPNPVVTLTPQVRRTMRTIILAQCAGVLAGLLFNSGFMLSYLSLLGTDSASILLILSLPNLLVFLFTLPFAFIADQHGKKRLGTLGLITTVLGFLLVFASSLLPPDRGRICAITGICVYSTGLTFFSASWFALLEPIIPGEIRGRFFGRLRFSWQTVGIVFNGVVIYLLHHHSSMGIYRAILLTVSLFLAVRIFYYRQIPELESTRATHPSFRRALRHSLTLPGYFPFCSYTFLLMLFTGAMPWIFGLLEKDLLGFSDSQIVLMGNLLFAGSLGGFYLGGKMVDRWGTRMVFLICHFSFAGVLATFLLRDAFPLPATVVVGSLTALFGLIQASSGIAITTEMMGLIPTENKSLASALSLSLLAAGAALSGILSSKAIQLGMLSPTWTLFGNRLSNYDSLIAVSAVMILLLVVTLGLIPSVMRKAHWVPQGN